MRPIHFLPLAAAAFLAACGDSEEDVAGDADLSAVADAAVMARPGQYTTTAEMLELSIPGVDDSTLEMIRGQMQQGAITESSFCLTEEDAARGRQDMLKKMSESDCTVTKFDASGGSIDAAMQCNDPEGMNGTVGVTGTMAEESSDIVMDFEQNMPGAGSAKIRMRVKSQRTGACT